MNKTMIILFFSIVVVYIFLNLGNFLDITKKPEKADIIVALGGDHDGSRVKKAASLYKEGISKSGIFLYTGSDNIYRHSKEFKSRKQYLLNQNIRDKNIFHISSRVTANTMEELLFIKKYMLYNKYTSVIVVSHPYHSRRIETLANTIAGYKCNGLKLSTVSSNLAWWKKSTYFTNKTALKAAFLETVKLMYNLIKYSPPLIKYTNYSKRNKEIKWDSIVKNNKFSVK